MGLDRIMCTARCFVLFLPSPWVKDIYVNIGVLPPIW